MAALSVVTFRRKKYYVDQRLNQLRNVNNPHDVIDTHELDLSEMMQISKQLQKKK